MEQTQRSAEYVFQGTMYFYRASKIQCRYQFTLDEAVDPAALQAALDSVLARADYYRVRLVWEKRNAFLEPNPEPCRIRTDSVMPQIPEQTNGYLFSVGCEGDTLYLDWYHFIADGHGMSQLASLLLKEYWNLRHGASFAREPLASDPPYDIEAMLRQYPEDPGENDLHREVLQTCEGAPRRVLVRLDKQSMVQAGLRCGAKPFSALTGLLCQACRLYFGKDTVRYAYSTDTRDAVGVPNAQYNCVASFQGDVTFPQSARLQDVLPGLDADIRANLQPESKLRRMTQQMGWIYKVSQQKASLKIKQRIFQMGEYVSGVPADFWISYVGGPLIPAERELEQHMRDFQVWVPADGASMGVEATSLNGVVTLCIQNKAQQPGLAEAIRTACEREGVRVLEARELDG